MTVLTAMPNYPTGRVFEGYRRRWYSRTTQDETDVIRAWIWPRPGHSWLSRGLTYCSFAFSALFVGIFHAPRADLLIWETPPLVLGPTACLLSRIKGARMVTNVSDLWPASLVAVGVLRAGIVLKTLEKLERFLYRKSAAISGQTEHIIADIQDRVPEVPAVLWRNGVDAHAFASGNRAMWREQWQLPQDRFVVGYAGLFGMTQGIEVICHTAELLRDVPVTFVMVGDGPARKGLIDLTQMLGLSDLLWMPSCPHEDMPGVWSAFDCTIICLRNLALFRGAVPSKTYEAMAAGVPVILSVEGEAAGIIRDSDAGIVVEPENPQQMAEAIEALRTDPVRRKRLGQNGLRTATRNYDRQILNGAYINALVSVAQPPAREQ